MKRFLKLHFDFRWKMLEEAFSRLDMTYDQIASLLFKDADDATKLDFWTATSTPEFGLPAYLVFEVAVISIIFLTSGYIQKYKIQREYLYMTRN